MKFFKLIFLTLILASYPVEMFAQYTPLRIKDRTRTDYESFDGIQAQIEYNYKNDGYIVTLFNSNYNDSNDYTTYTFKWYLSYKGKRISDYYHERMKCRSSETKVVYAWPGEVPRGNEKYVTVQFGEEPRKKDKKDRRD